jgi:hypothetical protein
MEILMSDIFDQLAQSQTSATPAPATGTGDVFDQLAANGGNLPAAPKTPEETPLSAKPIPDQPAPSRQRQEFLRRTGGGATTEKAVGEANKTAAENAALMVATEGVSGVASKLLAPTVETVSKATGLLDAAGNPLMKEVETEGPSLAKQGVAKAVEVGKQVAGFAKQHPITSTVSASLLEGLAHELGVDPFELAKKAVKFGVHIVGD